ncbi:Uncharacterised protein [Mycobacteroides abscessus subsp. abscessus]|nr:Uncharacterised protein [Mycobacteroides abscessus subsp. abscessus]SLJ82154.1 Uncharacterised protein [Mycobacteroides abscessus subsp. abscessus]
MHVQLGGAVEGVAEEVALAGVSGVEHDDRAAVRASDTDGFDAPAVSGRGAIGFDVHRDVLAGQDRGKQLSCGCNAHTDPHAHTRHLADLTRICGNRWRIGCYADYVEHKGLPFGLAVNRPDFPFCRR